MELNYLDITLLVVFFLIITIYGYGSYKNSYFKRKGIKSTPSYPFVGHFLHAFLKKKHFADVFNEPYFAFPNQKYVGMYSFMTPSIVIRDLDLIKQITIKDFDHFQDHQQSTDENMDPLLGKTLLNLQGQQWKNMRATLSPAFTSSKMRNMFAYVVECGEHMADYYIKKIQESIEKVEEIEMKEAFNRYANDVIASVAFGIKIDSMTDKKNDFFVLGRELTSIGTFRFFRMLLITGFPRIARLLGITLLGSKISNFFRSLVSYQMQQREAGHIVRQDMLHLLIQAKKGSLKLDNNVEERNVEFASVEESNINMKNVESKWNDDHIVAQAILFFFAGFETAATALSFMANELAINEDVQRKLQAEIDEVKERNGGKIIYEDLLNMKYMDMVVSEVLRKWPPAVGTDRKCVKKYTLPPSAPGSEPYTLNVKDGLIIPIYAIHRDPQYYKDPEKFDPERFSEENKSSILPSTYLPFGLGPRNCIGSRFALMELKSIMFHLLAKFDIVATKKTANPIILDKKNSFTMYPEGGGFYVGLKLRKKL